LARNEKKKRSETFSNSEGERETSPYKRALVKSRTEALSGTHEEEEEEEKRFFFAFSFPVERERGTVPGLRRWKREALQSFRNTTTRKNRRPPFRFLKKPRGRRERERDGDDVVFGVRVGVSSVVFCSPEELLRE
jgi:hypothetical protein